MISRYSAPGCISPELSDVHMLPGQFIAMLLASQTRFKSQSQISGSSKPSQLSCCSHHHLSIHEASSTVYCLERINRDRFLYKATPYIDFVSWIQTCQLLYVYIIFDQTYANLRRTTMIPSWECRASSTNHFTIQNANTSAQPTVVDVDLNDQMVSFSYDILVAAQVGDETSYLKASFGSLANASIKWKTALDPDNGFKALDVKFVDEGNMEKRQTPSNPTDPSSNVRFNPHSSRYNPRTPWQDSERGHPRRLAFACSFGRRIILPQVTWSIRRTVDRPPSSNV